MTRLELPADAVELLENQSLTQETFIMWDLIHDRTHMRGDLPFDPFMIKQRMPYFLYSLEELRCDLTAYRESVAVEADLSASPRLASTPNWSNMLSFLTGFSVLPSPARAFATTTGWEGSCCLRGCTSTMFCTGPTPS